MAPIWNGEYSKAQQYLNQSYALAIKRHNYYTSNIDTQQARLFILFGIRENDGIKIYEWFKKADHLLCKLENSVYKFRQVIKYRDFFDSTYSKLADDHKSHFHRSSKKMLIDIVKEENYGNFNIGQQKTIRNAKRNLEYILNKINANEQSERSYVDATALEAQTIKEVQVAKEELVSKIKKETRTAIETQTAEAAAAKNEQATQQVQKARNAHEANEAQTAKTEKYKKTKYNDEKENNIKKQHKKEKLALRLKQKEKLEKKAKRWGYIKNVVKSLFR